MRTLIQIKAGHRAAVFPLPMVDERANDLARACTELVRSGNDFPTVWVTRLKSHPLVNGIPRQRITGCRTLLDIALVTGERLVFDGDARRFSLE